MTRPTNARLRLSALKIGRAITEMQKMTDGCLQQVHKIVAQAELEIISSLPEGYVPEQDTPRYLSDAVIQATPHLNETARHLVQMKSSLECILTALNGHEHNHPPTADPEE